MEYLDWKIAINGFADYLTLERALSANSTEAYLRDVRKLSEYAENKNIQPLGFTYTDAQDFLVEIGGWGLSRTSVGRTLSGARAFFNYLVHTDQLDGSPFELIENPRQQRKLPVSLSYSEVLDIFASVDLSDDLGHRNRAILECLYGCGLRASELTGLRFSDIFESDGVIRVVGKGNKQRLTPIATTTLKYLKFYLEQRIHLTAQHREDSDIIFLNRRGGKLSRVMIFNIVRDAAKKAGITKGIYPHVLRHSFATHLVDGGADIRAVQSMLGHSSISTTQIYTHISTMALRSAVEQLRPEL